MIELELPYPPSINHYYGRRPRGGVYIKAKGKAYREAVSLLMTGIQPVDGPLAVKVEVHPPDKRRRDLDNIKKALLDALQHGGAYHDDCQIVDLHSLKRSPIKGGKVHVRIKPDVPTLSNF